MQKQRIVLFLIRFLIHNPRIFLIALLLGGLSYSYEVFIAREAMSFGGIPQSTQTSLTTFTRIFRNDAYMVGYSDIRGNPLWVVYRLDASCDKGAHLKRPDNFTTDWRTLGLVTSEDYSHSGYDRGHMAPNHAIALCYGKQAQAQTFLMSNITPQKPTLNQKLWQRLEAMEIDEFLPKFKTLWVYTGPIFNEEAKKLKNSFIVEIPVAFYKIYIGIQEDGTMKSLAFMIPQNAKPYDSLEKYLVSIDDIEAASGLNFLPNLEKNQEIHLEKQKRVAGWF